MVYGGELFKMIIINYNRGAMSISLIARKVYFPTILGSLIFEKSLARLIDMAETAHFVEGDK